jgi:hypothetical protein
MALRQSAADVAALTASAPPTPPSLQIGGVALDGGRQSGAAMQAVSGSDVFASHDFDAVDFINRLFPGA